MHVWNMLHAASWKIQDAKNRQKSPSAHRRTTLSGYIFANKAFIDNRKKMLNSNISSTCSHNMVNFCLLTAEICWRVWGTPAHFNRFRVLASLLYQRRWTEVNKTLQDVWPSSALVHYITEFSLLLIFNRGRYLYSEDGRLDGHRPTF